MPKFLRLNEIAAILNESPEIIVKECELKQIPYNRTSEGEYLFTIEDVSAVRKPTPRYTTRPAPGPQDGTPTKSEKKPKGEKKAR